MPVSENPASSRATLIVLLLGVFLGALDVAIVGLALPALRESFDIDPAGLSWVVNVYILFGLIGAPLMAAWSDRFGRRPIYFLCLAGFGVGSLIVALAPSYPVLLVGRAVQAFGAGGLLPVAGAVIADTFPFERRGRALGLIGAVFGIAFVIGPVIGGVLLRYSWRYLFVVNLPLVVGLLFAAWRLLPHTKAARPGIFDWRGAAALAVGLSSLAWAVSGIDTADALDAILLDPRFFGAVIVGLASLSLFWWAEQHASSPVILPALLDSLQMRVVGTLALATGFVEAGILFLPSLAVTAFGVEASTASFMLLPLVAAVIVGSVIAGRLLDRVGAKPVIQAGMGLTVVGLVLFGVVPLAPASFYAAGFCVGFGLASLLGAPLRFVALEEGGAAGRGASQGLLTVGLAGGRMLGAALIGGIAGSDALETAGFRRAMLAIAVACAVSLFASAWLRNTRSRTSVGGEASEPGSRT